MLLDTNALIWLLTDIENIGKTAMATIRQSDDLYVSIVSQYEVAIKQRLGKIDLLDKLESEMHEQFIVQIPLDSKQFSRLAALTKLGHRDPFDLLIIALAIERKLTLITGDRTILSMQIPGLQLIDARK